eukprot:scaffold825_cov249-Pinguiococcus_pyrenoidosus.AAC.43
MGSKRKTMGKSARKPRKVAGVAEDRRRKRGKLEELTSIVVGNSSKTGCPPVTLERFQEAPLTAPPPIGVLCPPDQRVRHLIRLFDSCTTSNSGPGVASRVDASMSERRFSRSAASLTFPAHNAGLSEADSADGDAVSLHAGYSMALPAAARRPARGPAAGLRG